MAGNKKQGSEIEATETTPLLGRKERETGFFGGIFTRETPEQKLARVREEASYTGPEYLKSPETVKKPFDSISNFVKFVSNNLGLTNLRNSFAENPFVTAVLMLVLISIILMVASAVAGAIAAMPAALSAAGPVMAYGLTSLAAVATVSVAGYVAGQVTRVGVNVSKDVTHARSHMKAARAQKLLENGLEVETLVEKGKKRTQQVQEQAARTQKSLESEGFQAILTQAKKNAHQALSDNPEYRRLLQQGNAIKQIQQGVQNVSQNLNALQSIKRSRDEFTVVHPESVVNLTRVVDRIRGQYTIKSRADAQVNEFLDKLGEKLRIPTDGMDTESRLSALQKHLSAPKSIDKARLDLAPVEESLRASEEGYKDVKFNMDSFVRHYEKTKERLEAQEVTAEEQLQSSVSYFNEHFAKDAGRIEDRAENLGDIIAASNEQFKEVDIQVRRTRAAAIKTQLQEFFGEDYEAMMDVSGAVKNIGKQCGVDMGLVIPPAAMAEGHEASRGAEVGA